MAIETGDVVFLDWYFSIIVYNDIFQYIKKPVTKKSIKTPLKF